MTNQQSKAFNEMQKSQQISFEVKVNSICEEGNKNVLFTSNLLSL